MTGGRRRLAVLLVLPVLMTGCIDEIGEIFTIIVFSESDDPDVRETGAVMDELRQADEARAEIDRFLETGDEQFLESAISIRPNDTEAHGYKLALATLEGDPGEIAAATEALSLAEARRLAALRAPGDPPTSAQVLRRNVLGELLVAQTRMLGGSLTRRWDPPGADAPPDQRQLFADYCATKAEIERDFADDLSYVVTPDCT